MNQTEKKVLLVFAHYGEAQQFIKKEDFAAIDFHFRRVYENDRSYLLITGEGVQSTTERLAAFAAVYRNKIAGVVNLGIAGSLDERYGAGQIHPVRTVYGQQDSGMAFQTFTSASPEATLDCISAANRVLDKTRAAKLGCFATLVDRELWAIGSVCSLYSLPFRGYKLISDIAGDDTDCLDIRERAVEFSDTLYRFYKTWDSAPQPLQEEAGAVLEELHDFHLSASQRRQLKRLFRSLKIKYDLSGPELLQTVNSQEILVTESNPKKRTTLLIEKLSDLLNPFNAELRQILDSYCEPLRKVNCRVQFARDYEDDTIELAVRIQDPAHLEAFRQALARFAYRDVIRILNGHIDHR